MKRRTTAQMQHYFERYRALLADLEAGLNGQPFSWRLVDRQHNTPLLRALGLTLVTKTKLERDGYRLIRDVQPVGRVYYAAPISGMRDVYLLECQCEQVPIDEPPAARQRARDGGEDRDAL